MNIIATIAIAYTVLDLAATVAVLVSPNLRARLVVALRNI
jgi:hypothetical protein